MTPRKAAAWIAGLLVLALAAGDACGQDPLAEDFVPPPGAGYVNIKTDAGAKGDGVADDTAALRAVIEAGKSQPHPTFGPAREIYFPNGVYLVRGPIRIGDKKKTLIGQSRDGAVIRLRDRAPEFQDPGRPTPVLSVTGQPFMIS